MLSRSLLFVPANQEKMLAKINELNADIILIDLEDAVALEEKEKSRELVKNSFPEINKPVFIRVNSTDTKAFKYDMKVIKELCEYSSLKGVMLPKSNSKKRIEELDATLSECEKLKNRKSQLLIIPLLEDALGIHNIDEIILASNRITKLAFGGEDFRENIRAQGTSSEHELLYARSRIVLASSVHRIEKPIDTVYPNFKDIEGFKKSSVFVKSLGFGGKLLIHPSQIAIANDSFSPTLKEVEVSKEIMSSSKNTKGAFNMNGKMIDKPIIEKAKQIIDEYNLINEKKGGMKNEI